MSRETHSYKYVRVNAEYGGACCRGDGDAGTVRKSLDSFVRLGPGGHGSTEGLARRWTIPSRLQG